MMPFVAAISTPPGRVPLRRALLAVGVAGIIAGAIRLVGAGSASPQGRAGQSSGWRELSGPELR